MDAPPPLPSPAPAPRGLRPPHTQGFTLLEMLIVVGLVSMLAAVLTGIVLSAQRRAASVEAEAYMGNAAVIQELAHEGEQPYVDAGGVSRGGPDGQWLQNTVPAMTALGLRKPPAGVSLEVLRADGRQYCMRALHAKRPDLVWYATESRGVVRQDRTEAPLCTATSPAPTAPPVTPPSTP